MSGAKEFVCEVDGFDHDGADKVCGRVEFDPSSGLHEVMIDGKLVLALMIEDGRIVAAYDTRGAA